MSDNQEVGNSDNVLNLGLEGDISEEEKLLKTQKELLFGSLKANIDVNHVKDIIRRNIPEKRQGNVFHCIWFFSTTLPDVGEQLLKCVEENKLEEYIDLAYKNIYQAIDMRIDKTYHDKWNMNTPWKQDIKEMIIHIQDKKKMVDNIKAQTWAYIRWNGPTVALWLLPTQWIDIQED